MTKMLIFILFFFLKSLYENKLINCIYCCINVFSKFSANDVFDFA